MLNFSLLGYVEVGFLKRYPYPWHTDYTLHISKCSSSLGPNWESNQARLGWQVGARARLTDNITLLEVNPIEMAIRACHREGQIFFFMKKIRSIKKSLIFYIYITLLT